ncbi:MAG TPA: hypothetical protein EYQ31_16745 [Candidatus Handelsmanbacteria bacterium]|nr:hypothetical protein [Candidatus Handelsmanbacteria bacterium]
MYLRIPTPWDLALPDADDAVFLEVAKAGGVHHLVTGNVRHFPVSKRRNLSVVTPVKFLDLPRVRSL